MDQSRTCQDVISSPTSVAALMYPTSSIDAKKKTECVEPSFRIRMHPVLYLRKYVRPSGNTHTLHQLILTEPGSKGHCCPRTWWQFQVRPTGVSFVEVDDTTPQLLQVGRCY